MTRSACGIERPPDNRHLPGMRVLMTADALGGVWTYSVGLAFALARRGVQTALAVMGGRPSEAQRRQAEQVEGLRLFESEFRLEWMDDPWDDVARASDWLLELEERVRPDLVHLNGYAHGALPWRTPCLVVGHSCVLSWWEAVKGEKAPPRYDRYAEVVREGLQSADVVVAPTAAFGRCLSRHYGSLPDLRTIHNARRASEFPCGRKEPFVLAAGRLWDEAKNIAAVERVAPRLPWHVYAAGDEHPGRSEGALQGLGRLSPAALADWYRRASIFVHPARYEPFGLAPLEAALAGCALVLGDIPTLREVWRNAAVYVDPDDDAQLRETLSSLIEYPGRRRRVAERARRQALTSYTPAAMAAAYRQVYDEMCGRRHRPRRGGPARASGQIAEAPGALRHRQPGVEAGGSVG